MRCIAIVGVWVALATCAVAGGIPGRNHGGGGYRGGQPGGYVPGGMGCGYVPTCPADAGWGVPPVHPRMARAIRAAELRAIRPPKKEAYRWQLPRVVAYTP